MINRCPLCHILRLKLLDYNLSLRICVRMYSFRCCGFEFCTGFALCAYSFSPSLQYCCIRLWAWLTLGVCKMLLISTYIIYQLFFTVKRLRSNYVHTSQKQVKKYIEVSIAVSTNEPKVLSKRSTNELKVLSKRSTKELKVLLKRSTNESKVLLRRSSHCSRLCS